MALQPCRECGEMVSTEASSCPKCGVPNPTTLPAAEAPGQNVVQHAGSFTSDNLATGEVIVYRAHRHWVLFTWAALFTVLWAAFFFMGGPDLYMARWFTFGIAAIAWLVSYIVMRSTEFVITNKRVTTKTGIVKRNSLETLLEKVETVGIHQDLMGRMLGYGDVTVSGTGGSHEVFHTIAKPLELRRMVHEQVERSKR
jgi:hypothetical protein